MGLMGILVYAVPPAMNFLSHFPESSRGILVVPSLILYSMPPWFTGIALLGIFIGGLVPAAIMAISQANLLTRNIIKEIRQDYDIIIMITMRLYDLLHCHYLYEESRIELS